MIKNCTYLGSTPNSNALFEWLNRDSREAIAQTIGMTDSLEERKRKLPSQLVGHLL
jgi:hypothetical protein